MKAGSRTAIFWELCGEARQKEEGRRSRRSKRAYPSASSLSALEEKHAKNRVRGEQCR
jgi:hypothetical protein